jgi:hypothetical protein
MPPSTEEFLMDFRKEEKPEGGIRVKPAIYKARIGKTKVIRSSQKGTIGLAVPLLISVKGKKKKLIERLWMSPKAYHRFRELLEACGKKVPAGNADIRKIGRAVEGEEIYVNIKDDEQEGYDTKSTVAFQGGFISPDDYEDDDDTDEDDDDLDDDGDEEEEDDEELDDDGDDDDEEDEEDEPKRRRKTAPTKRRAAPKRRGRKKASDEDLDDLDLDDF